MLKWISPQLIKLNWLKLILIAILALGVFFRFFNLDKKVYWIDETYTSLRISGYRETELIQNVFNGRVVSVAELQKYQHPNSEKGLTDTIQSLAIESPQHPPFYYVMARFWVQFWGYSVTAIRSLSALISLLLFPCIYWLCLELFQSAPIGWTAIALIAISPFHVLYAQEAREYSLWTVTTALSSAALLRAMRLNTKGSWLIYAVSLATSLYTFLFSWFVVLGHIIYVFVTAKFRWSQRIKAYLLSSLLGLLVYAPWFWVTASNISHIQTSASWATTRIKNNFLLSRWLLDTSRLFFDLNQKEFAIPTILVLLISAYAVYFFCRLAPKNAQLFLGTLIGVQGLALLLPDTILGGLRSANPRYLIPCYLGLELIVAYWLVTQFKFVKKRWQERLWTMSAIALFLGGIISCTVSSQSVLWWNKNPIKHKHNTLMAQIVNQSDRPLLISDNSTLISDCFACRIIALSYNLDPKVKLQLVKEPNTPKIPPGFSDVFAFTPDENLLRRISHQQKYQVDSIFKANKFHFWKLTK